MNSIVRVMLDGQGVAERIELNVLWRKTIGEAGLGAAIIAADYAAAIIQLKVWSAAVSQESAKVLAANPVAVADARTVRQLGLLADEVLSNLDNLPGEPRSESVSVSSETIGMTLSAGRIIACDLDQCWLRSCPDPEIADVLNRALRRVRTIVAAKAQIERERLARLDSVFAELMAVMKDPGRYI